jgi:hypothetical protein
MSVLETPRIYFKGQVTWDPITTNNYDSNYEEGVGQTILPGVANRVKVFRDQAIEQVVTAGNWNPDGTHRATFFETMVCGFDIGSGIETDDPFVTAAANFLGMLVDLEPFGAYSSQLFFDAMRFGVDGGYRILAPRISRITDRYINFGRNTANTMIAGVASVIWQTSSAKTEGLRVDAFDSRALKSLAAAMEPDDVLGLTVRFNAYRTIYYDNPDLTNGSPAARAAAQALIAKLKEGGFQPNPARSLVVGVIGLWRKSEPPHESGDRALIQQGNSQVASAHIRLDQTTMTLDLSNSVPEVDKDLTKMDLGPLTVVAISPASQAVTTLGTFDYSQYDRAAYEARAGIVTVPLAAGAAQSAADGNLELRDAKGNTLLAELPLRAIPATPNLYLDEGERVTATFQVYNRGRPLMSAVPLTLSQISASGGAVDNTTRVTTDANGVLALPIIGMSSGITAYVPWFTPAENPAAGGLNTQVNTYMYVRMLPADAVIAELPPTWENVYVNVLANWNAMAPCMDNWLRLDDPVQVKAYADVLKRLTHPANFEHFRFMPVTRDMTAGMRTLLYKFLDAPGDDLAAKPVGQPPQTRSFAELSRAMRRGGVD